MSGHGHIGNPSDNSCGIKKAYIGNSSDKSRKWKKAYIGDENDKARLWFSSNAYTYVYVATAASTSTSTSYQCSAMAQADELFDFPVVENSYYQGAKTTDYTYFKGYYYCYDKTNKRVLRSQDLSTWTSVLSGILANPTGYLQTMSSSENYLFAVGGSSNSYLSLYWSSDGTTWTKSTYNANNNIDGIIYCDDSYIVLLISDTSANQSRVVRVSVTDVISGSFTGTVVQSKADSSSRMTTCHHKKAIDGCFAFLVNTAASGYAMTLYLYNITNGQLVWSGNVYTTSSTWTVGAPGDAEFIYDANTKMLYSMGSKMRFKLNISNKQVSGVKTKSSTPLLSPFIAYDAETQKIYVMYQPSSGHPKLQIYDVNTSTMSDGSLIYTVPDYITYQKSQHSGKTLDTGIIYQLEKG